MAYNKGDYYVLCARCGCKKLRSETVIDVSQGQDSTKPVWLVCKEHFDGIHPQTRKVPFIGDPKPIPGHLIRTETIGFREGSDVWNLIDINWEDIDRAWDAMNRNGDTVAAIMDTY